MGTRKIWIVVCAAATVLALAAGGYMATAGGFDSDRWKAQRSSAARDNPRAGMVGDLKGRLHAGMTRDEVVTLLGEPETKEPARYVYAIGTSAFGVDYEYYVIEFDAAGKLLRHAITRG